MGAKLRIITLLIVKLTEQNANFGNSAYKKMHLKTFFCNRTLQSPRYSRSEIKINKFVLHFTHLIERWLRRRYSRSEMLK